MFQPTPSLRGLIALFFLLPILAMAQDRGFNYQAAARDGSGNLLANQALTVGFLIHEGAAAGPVVYEETHNVNTNAYGLFDAIIGGGSPVSGTFGSIDWADDAYYLEVRLNGNALGTEELVEVPYAKVATDMSLADLDDVSSAAPGNGDVLQWNGSAWAPGAGGGDWQTTGTTLYYDAGRVFVGRSNAITNNEYFGVRTPTGAGTYGGMYIETENVTGRPFYGYATNGSARAWTYWEGADSSWRLYNSGTHLVVNQSGNVGIGTSTPQAKLHVDGDVLVNSAVGSLKVAFAPSGDGWYFATINGGEDLQLFEQEGGGGSERRMLVEQGGFLDIINGSGGFSVEGLRIVNNGTNNNAWTWYPSNGFSRLFLAFNGNQQGYFDGTNGAYVQTSDRSLKRNIQAYAPVLDKVMALHPYTYHYIHNEQNAPRSLGFVAQEIASDFPELVVETSSNGESDGIPLLGVNYAGFSVVAIKAIQEQQALIEAQAQRIEALEARLAALEARLD